MVSGEIETDSVIQILRHFFIFFLLSNFAPATKPHGIINLNNPK